MYPLLFSPVLFEKVWGGDSLAALHKSVKPGASVGESWELADLARTAPGGAGGAAVRSVVRNGPFAGRTLDQLITQLGDLLVPKAKLSSSGGYPLLVKYLDARQTLSVQVHPSPAYAAAHCDCHVKSESWLIMRAQEGSLIYNGVKPGVNPDEFRAALAGGGPGVVGYLNSVPAKVGDVHTLASGTCHALGAGVVALEVQTSSDTTYRVYDWGRAGRDLHIEEAMQCIDFSGKPPSVRPLVFVQKGASIAACDQVVTPDFSLSARSIGPEGFDLTLHQGPFMVTGGKGRLDGWLAGNRSLPLKAGDTGLEPMKVSGAPRLAGEATAPLQVVFASLA
jgi:mannose-6-phosphate isomerase